MRRLMLQILAVILFGVVVTLLGVTVFDWPIPDATP